MTEVTTVPQENGATQAAPVPPPPPFDTTLEDALGKMTMDTVEAAANGQEESNGTPQGTRMESPGLNDNQDGDNPLGEQEAVCASHGKRRRTAYMALQEDGRYICVPPNLCKMPRQQGSPGLQQMQPMQQMQQVPGQPQVPGMFMMPQGGMMMAPPPPPGPPPPQGGLVPTQGLPGMPPQQTGGPGRPMPLGIPAQGGGPGAAPTSPGDQSVLCVVHGKYRSARNMIRSDSGEYRCQPNYQCRLEKGAGGPGRKSPLHPHGLPQSGSQQGLLAPPSMPGTTAMLPRNTSSQMSLGSNLSVDEINRLTAMGINPGQMQGGQLLPQPIPQQPGPTTTTTMIDPATGQPVTYIMPQQHPGSQPQMVQGQGQAQFVVLQNSGSGTSLVGTPGQPQMMAQHPGLMPSGSSSSLLQAPMTMIQPTGSPPGLPRNQSSGLMQAPPQQMGMQPQHPGATPPGQPGLPPGQPQGSPQQMMMGNPHQQQQTVFVHQGHPPGVLPQNLVAQQQQPGPPPGAQMVQVIYGAPPTQQQQPPAQ